MICEYAFVSDHSEQKDIMNERIINVSINSQQRG